VGALIVTLTTRASESVGTSNIAISDQKNVDGTVNTTLFNSFFIRGSPNFDLPSTAAT
jgi:hypothetical protein